MRDLLARDVERELVLERAHALEERARVEVVRDVRRAERELARRGVRARGLLGADLGVLDDRVCVPAARDDADRLGRRGLGHDLGRAVGALADAVPEEDRVCDAHEAVVHAVSVNVVDLARGEVGENRLRRVGRGEGRPCGGVEAAVPIGRDSNAKGRLEEDFALRGEARERS